MTLPTRILLVSLVVAALMGGSATARQRDAANSAAHDTGHWSQHANQISAMGLYDPFAPVFIVASRKTYQQSLQPIARNGVDRRDSAGRDLVVAQVKAHQLPELSQRIHDRELRCGGFFAFATRAQADAFIRDDRTAQAMRATLVTYTIDNQATVDPWLPLVQETRLYDAMEHLSSYQNRYYQSSTGLSSAQWIRDTWQALANGRADVTTELFTDCGNCGIQPSVILTIQGVEAPNEIVVLGGHLDSISNSGSGDNMDAPGADDDGSGIATLTEVIRIALADGWQPKRTVKFMGYAAEEVGLRGSNAIAQSFAADGKNVVGVLQLDMTNWRVGGNDMRLITDNSNAALKQFLVDLFDEYLAPQGLTRGTYTCGYGCSDHASWTSAGYPSAMMFEGGADGYNPNIHTPGDTLQNMGDSAANSVKFAKLGLAFLGELAKTSGDGGNLPPSAGFSYTRNDLTVQFTDASTDSDGTIVSWDWDFGDGGSSTAQNPSHAYAVQAAYDVTLTVTDDDGTTDTVMMPVSLLGGELENGVPVTGIVGAEDSMIYWTLEVPADATNLQFQTTGSNGDADLYIKFGAPPTTSDYDCRSFSGTSNELCVINDADIQAGTYHVMVHAWAAYTNLTLVGSFDAPPPVGCGDGGVLANGVSVVNIECDAGSSQYWTLDVPAGATNLKFTATGGSGMYEVYVKEGSDPTPGDYDCRQTRYQAKPCTVRTPAAGTYHVLIYGDTAYTGVTLTGSYTAPLSGGGTIHADTRQVAIRDNATAERSIQVIGGKGNASGDALVSVNIATAYRGDLKVELVSPSGRVYALHNRTGGSADNLVATYRVNLLGEPVNGEWKLRVNDNAVGDQGLIKGWSVKF